MSDRATISICADDHVIECYDMRNRTMRDLFAECARIVCAVGGATGRSEILTKLGRDPTDGRGEGELLYREDCSEFPVVVDLTRQMAYLRDEYPLGHPGKDAILVTSVEVYRRLCDPYVMWPPGRPITFDTLLELSNEP